MRSPVVTRALFQCVQFSLRVELPLDCKRRRISWLRLSCPFYKVNDIVSSNRTIMDSITNLSATTEEVSASADSSLTVSDKSLSQMNEMNDLLNTIFDASNQMKSRVNMSQDTDNVTEEIEAEKVVAEEVEKE